jgi:glycolate oxidase iron-sulfur subunit
MQTTIAAEFLNTAHGAEADRILRSCVHCGFCTATCPTYQLLGDELDSPRGRIYLIKQMLEGGEVSSTTRTHLDRCLTCRACETTCPSGVRYGRLVDIGRELVEHKVPRGVFEKLQRWLLRKVFAYPQRFGALLRIGQWFRPVLPAVLAKKIPQRQQVSRAANTSAAHARKMLVLQGCVQRVATPATNMAAHTLLDKLGIELIAVRGAGCCGAVSHHLSAPMEALDFMRRNIDAWWPHVEQGAEAIVITASGCGAVVKDYGVLLQHDAAYAEKARRISALTRDISEIMLHELQAIPQAEAANVKVAFHSPCTLQHGQQLTGVVERILLQAGFTLCNVEDSHLCCGSAGTYSILQPKLSKRLLANKVRALDTEQPDIIATANIGCQLHLATGTDTPVVHWLELLDAYL